MMDHFGVDRAVLMGWSMGVNTAFELAMRQPERVTGIFAVAGVPGDTFATMLAPFRLPRSVARQPTVGLSRALHDWADDLAGHHAAARGWPHRRGFDPLRLHAADA